MSLKNLLASLIVLISFPAWAHLGRENGGGKGVMCNGRLQILEFYEAELMGKKILPAGPDLNSNLIRYGLAIGEALRTNRLKMSPEEIVLFARNEFSRRAFFHDGPLEITDDATLPPMKAGCSIVQIAIWDESNLISIDTKLWNMLDVQNRVALMGHEIIYAIARGLGAQMSDDSRHVIREVFTNPDPERRISKDFLTKAYADCFSGELKPDGEHNHFIVLEEKQSGRKGLGFYFAMIKNGDRSVRTRGFLPNCSLKKLLKGDIPLTKGPRDQCHFEIRLGIRTRGTRWAAMDPRQRSR